MRPGDNYELTYVEYLMQGRVQHGALKMSRFLEHTLSFLTCLFWGMTEAHCFCGTPNSV